MPAPEHILNKIKLLFKLKQSPNLHEAEAANSMAEKLILKYNVSQEELESLKDPQPLYGEDEKLYSSIGIIGWKQQLALAISTYFESYLVQEELVPGEGSREYNYYIYGDATDVAAIKFVFSALFKKVENLILSNCLGRGPIFIDSYSEGVVQSIKQNLELYGLDLPEKQVPSRNVSDNKIINNGSSNLSKVKVDKEKPLEKSTDINSQSLIKDIGAYFKGVADGGSISLNDSLEMESNNENIKEIL